MIVAAHQPNYLPWPGYFVKASKCDVFVFLDSVQFPRGSSFVNRNRIKTPSGQPFWLSVPVKKKGRGFQPIKDVLIEKERDWRRKHELSLIHAYSRAPYFKDYRDFFSQVYHTEWQRLVDVNLAVLKHLMGQMGLKVRFRLSSELQVEGKGTDLLIRICKSLGADTYLSGSAGRKYLEEAKFTESGISLLYYRYQPEVYPQLWGDFVANLSVLDYLFNCGHRALRYLLSGG